MQWEKPENTVSCEKIIMQFMKRCPEIKKNIISDAFSAALKGRGGATQTHSRAHQAVWQHIPVPLSGEGSGRRNCSGLQYSTLGT